MKDSELFYAASCAFLPGFHIDFKWL